MGVTIAPGCFDVNEPDDPEWDSPDATTGQHGGGWEAEPRFRVVTDTVERAADALLVVAERFMDVSESGRELSDEDYDADDFDDEADRTPSVTHVSVDDEAAYVSADTSWLSHAMAERMKYILVQELTVAGVTAVIEADYDPIRGIGAHRWPRVTQ